MITVPGGGTSPIVPLIVVPPTLATKKSSVFWREVVLPATKVLLDLGMESCLFVIISTIIGDILTRINMQ